MDSTDHPTAGSDGRGMSAEEIAQLERICRHLRTSIINTVADARDGTYRRVAVGSGNPGGALLPRLEHRSFPPRLARARSLHPEQGPRQPGLLLHAGLPRLFSGRETGPVRRRRLDAARASQPVAHAGGRHVDRFPGPGALGRGRHGRSAATIWQCSSTSTFFWATGNCRRGRSGKPPCSPACTGSPDWWPSSTATACNSAVRSPTRSPLEPLADKWKAFGWQVVECDGHDVAAVVNTLEQARRLSAAGPVAVIAHTVKGKGVSFMEGKYQWHGRSPNEEERRQALAEIEQAVRQE